VEVSYPLYSGGLKKLTKIYADLEQKSVVFDHDSARNQLGSAGVELWYQFLIAKERFQTETKSLRRVEKHLEDIQVRYSGGSVLKTDLLSVKVRVEETRLALVSAENTLEVARTTLLAFLGLAFDTKIRVKESEFSYPKMPEPLHAAIEYAMQHRPEIKREQINADIAKKSMQIAGAGKKWNIGLMGQYNFNDEDLGFSQGEENWMLGVRFQKNLFDTGLTDARKSEAKAALELQSRKIEKTYIDIKLDVKNCYEDLIHAREAVRVAGTNLELAEENLSLMKQQYQGGSVTVTALLDADQAYSNALLNEVSSRYRAKMAKARFGRAIGFCLSCLNENISLSEDKGGLK
jgi:outer membrane protein TolC